MVLKEVVAAYKGHRNWKLESST